MKPTDDQILGLSRTAMRFLPFSRDVPGDMRGHLIIMRPVVSCETMEIVGAVMYPALGHVFWRAFFSWKISEFRKSCSPKQIVDLVNERIRAAVLCVVGWFEVAI